MAMTVANNIAAQLTLGEVRRNDTTLTKSLKKVSSGMKINSAGDDASGFSISEKMRVRIRSLGQDEINVKNGSALLAVAEGGVQNQIELLKKVKERVINAANDTNSDTDRAIIQKEISQFYEEIQDIALETNYNGKRLLSGNDFWKTTYIWEIKDRAEYLSGSADMGVIPDEYATLDGVTGPFDIFTDYDLVGDDIKSLGITAEWQNFTGGENGDPNTITMSLSTYNSVEDLDNVGFSINGDSYVLTTDPDRNYRSGGKIDISGCSSIDDVLKKIADKVSGASYQAADHTVTFKTSDDYNARKETSNAMTVTGISLAGGSETRAVGGSPAIHIPAQEEISIDAPGTGLFTSRKYFEGGKQGFYNPYEKDDPDARGSYPGKAAKLVQDISSAQNGSGVTIHAGSNAFLIFSDGAEGLQRNPDGSYTVGKNAVVSNEKIAGVSMSLRDGVLTLTAGEGAHGNNYYVEDSVHYHLAGSDEVNIPAIPPTMVITEYTEVKPIDVRGVINHQTGTNGTDATFTIDLSKYKTNTSMDELNKLLYEMYAHVVLYGSGGYEFLDSEILGIGSINKISGTETIDVSPIRDAVRNGSTIAEAVAQHLSKEMGNASIIEDSDGRATGVLLTARYPGARGNQDSIMSAKGTLRAYEVDYGKWFDDHPGFDFPGDLYGKGFRVYCASDSVEWFNFLFMPRTPQEMDERPESGTDVEEIKTIPIDVSGVTSAGSLVKAIYEQATPVLTGKVKPFLNSTVNYDHFMRLAADINRGVLTVYDRRRHELNPIYYPDLQEMGAKIADGCYDNIVLSERNLTATNIIIHHTDHASQNIRLTIPRTTLDYVLNYNPGSQSADDFHVLTKESRDRLLGVPPKKGVIDNGLEYLTGVNTLIGAQNMKLGQALEKIVTTLENTTAAESVIRDADMAKEMTEYTKASVLAQASNAMLAQANHVNDHVLSLLQ